MLDQTKPPKASSSKAPNATLAASPRRLGLAPIFALTLVLAACSLIYELVLAQTLSALLGNTVLRYSLTIGTYLGALGFGAMICGDGEDRPRARLITIELALCLVGGLAVPSLFVMDLGLVHLLPASSSQAMVDWIFLAYCHLVIFAVGFLSGFEIPLLMALAARVRDGVANQVLGVDYFGSLLGSIAFPLILLPWAGLVATGFLVASLNVLVLIALALSQRTTRGRVLAGLGAGLLGLYGLGLGRAEAIEARFAETLFSAYRADSWSELWAGDPRVEVEYSRSRYQAITIGALEDPSDWIFDVFSDRAQHDPDHPDDLWLYLDDQFQLYSAGEEFYHEWFIHVPIQAQGFVPRQVALVGAGDGMALRELLRYPEVERVVWVELDPEMIELARTHPKLRALNGGAFADPRVELVLGDAFSWLRTQAGAEVFDAIYVDAPYARNYDLSRLYSREFYAMTLAHLSPRGFLAFDAPGGWCGYVDEDWTRYSSTLLAGGYASVEYYASRVSLDSPRVEAAIEASVQLAAGRGGGEPEALESMIEDRIAAALARDFPEHDFILALPEASPSRESLRWHDFGVHHHALAPEHLPLAFDAPEDACPLARDDAAVNSVFRPTLPELAVGDGSS